MLLVGVVLVSVLSSGLAGDEACAGRDTKKTSTEERLLKHVMCGYVDDMRPVKDHKTAVVVTVHMSIRYMSFDPLEETLTVHSWLGLHWVDEYLNWDPANFGGLEELQIQSHRIWQPELALYNADANTYPSSSFYSPCVVNNTGHVLCVPHVSRSSICTTHLRNWPYDTQNCTMRFGSWMHTGEQVNFVFSKKAVSTEDFVPGPGWGLVSVTHERLPGVYKAFPNDTYPELRFYVALKRHAAGPAAVVVVPSVVIVMLTLSSLLLDVRDSTRLCLACFSLFGHFVFLTEIGYDLPKHSSDTPIILLFLRDSMVLNLVGILLTLVLSNLRMRADTPYVWVATINGFFSGAAKFAVFTEFEPGLLYEKTEDQSDETSAAEKRAAANRAWTSFCNVLNSVTFAVLLLAYVILLTVYLPKRDG